MKVFSPGSPVIVTFLGGQKVPGIVRVVKLGKALNANGLSIDSVYYNVEHREGIGGASDFELERVEATEGTTYLEIKEAST